MDLGYHLPGTSISCYPSLMSPISTFDKFKQASRSKGIFERLQADTELRLRARHNSVSSSKLIYERPAVAIEDKLIRKGKERETRLRHLIEQEELKRNQVLQDRPYVSPKSKAILDGKTLNNSRSSKLSQVYKKESNEKIQTNEKNGKPEDKTSDNGKAAQLSTKISQDLKQTPHTSIKNCQSQLIKQLQHSYQLLSKKKSPQAATFEVKCSNRKYIPSFQHSNRQSLQPKSFSASSSSILFKPRPAQIHKELSPSSYLTSQGGVSINEALSYQQMIRDRVVNSINR